jgi:hypothetical protein
MQVLVIKGNYMGGCVLKDLGLNVPYGEERMIPVDRASWSSDLSSAISQHWVIKVGVRGHTVRPPTPYDKPPYSYAEEDPVALGDTQKTLAELRSLNADLTSKVALLVDSQAELIAALKAQVPKSTAQDPSPSQSSRVDSSWKDTVFDQWEDEEDLIFIPSSIRSETTSVSASFKATEEVEETSSKMEESAKALALLKSNRNKE